MFYFYTTPSIGLGNPIASLYARSYLLAMGSSVAPECVTSVANSLLQDTLFGLSMLKEAHMQSEFLRLQVSEKTYIHLLSPGMEWIVNFVGKSATR